jgi:CheY-like chemotaxis protein
MESKKILVIDDDPFIREALQKSLNREGYITETAPNIHSAVDKVAQNWYDLILCDVMIPELGGFELIEQIKSDPTRRQIPIIMVTGMDKDILQMTRHEADAVVTKPFETQQLLAEIRKFI